MLKRTHRLLYRLIISQGAASAVRVAAAFAFAFAFLVVILQGPASAFAFPLTWFGSHLFAVQNPFSCLPVNLMGLSTHILDTALGRPATSVGLSLWKLQPTGWQQLGIGTTDADGRCKTLLGLTSLEAGEYSIRFETGPYYAAQNLEGLYPHIAIVFTVRDPTQHHHIPLLLTANGYTTYRGT